MAFQVTSPYGQSNIDQHLANLAASESEAAQRGMAGMAQQQSMQLGQQQLAQNRELAQMGQAQSQAEMQNRMQLEQQRQQFEAQQMSSRQSFESQQNQMLMAAQQKATKEAQEAALALKTIEVEFQIAQAQGRVDAAKQLRLQMEPLRQKQADAAFQTSLLGKRMELTEEMLSGLGERLSEASKRQVEIFDKAKNLGAEFTQTARTQLTATEMKKAGDAAKLLGIQRKTQAGGAAVTGGFAALALDAMFGQEIGLANEELTGLQYVQFQPSMGIAERFMPGVEASAGLVRSVDSPAEIRNKVQANVVESMIATISTIPGLKNFNADAARTALNSMLSGGGQGDPTQQLIGAGIDPVTLKTMFENLARDANEEAVKYEGLSSQELMGGNRSLRSIVLGATATAAAERRDMLARAAGSMTITDVEDLKLLARKYDSLSQAGQLQSLAGAEFAGAAQRYGFAPEYEQLINYLSEGRMGPGMPIRSRRELEADLIAAQRAEDTLGEEQARLITDAEALGAGGELDAYRQLLQGIQAERKRLVP